MTDHTVHVLWETHDLLITVIGGTTSTLAIIFAGVAFDEKNDSRPEMASQVPEGEFNHVIYVVDRQKSWFTTEGIQEMIYETVWDFIEANEVTNVYCQGNGMGGFGAIAFAARFNADFVLAFSPQFSMDPMILDDRRWPRYLPFIDVDNMLHLNAQMTDAVRYCIFYGDQDPIDLAHCQMFAEQGRARIYIVRNTSHHVAYRLGELRLHRPIKAALAANDMQHLDAIVEPFVVPGPYFD